MSKKCFACGKKSGIKDKDNYCPNCGAKLPNIQNPDSELEKLKKQRSTSILGEGMKYQLADKEGAVEGNGVALKILVGAARSLAYLQEKDYSLEEIREAANVLKTIADAEFRLF